MAEIVPKVDELHCSSFAALLLPAVKINTANPTDFLPGTAKFPKVVRPLFKKLYSKSILNDVDRPQTIRIACICVLAFLPKTK